MSCAISASIHAGGRAPVLQLHECRCGSRGAGRGIGCQARALPTRSAWRVADTGGPDRPSRRSRPPGHAAVRAHQVTQHPRRGAGLPAAIANSLRFFASCGEAAPSGTLEPSENGVEGFRWKCRRRFRTTDPVFRFSSAYSMGGCSP